MKRVLLALAILLIAALPAASQQDEEGCKDHPLFPRVPTFQISGCDSEPSDSFEFEKAGGVVRVEGRYSKIDYWVRENAVTPEPLQILRRYRNLVAAKGGTKLLERLDSDGARLTATVPGPKGSGAVWVEVYVTMGGECYSLVIVEEKAAR